MVPNFIFSEGATIRTLDNKSILADEVELYDEYVICIWHDPLRYRCMSLRYVKFIDGVERR